MTRRSQSFTHISIFVRSAQENFDSLILKLQTISLPEAFESVISRSLEAIFTALWIYLVDHAQLYSPTSGRLAPVDRGLLGFVFHTASILTANPQSSHVNFDPEWDARLVFPESSVLIFPVCFRHGSVQASMHLGRDSSMQSPFLQSDMATAKALARKCRLYCRYLWSPTSQVKIAFDLAQFTTFPAVGRCG